MGAAPRLCVGHDRKHAGSNAFHEADQKGLIDLGIPVDHKPVEDIERLQRLSSEGIIDLARDARRKVVSVVATPRSKE